MVHKLTILLNIDPIIQAICVCVVALFGWQAWRMRSERLTAVGAMQRFGNATKDVPRPMVEDAPAGLQEDATQILRSGMDGLTGPEKRWWTFLDSALESYGGPQSAKCGYFVTRPHVELLSRDELIGSLYHSALYRAMPGILTGVGLLGTFVAILVALSGVTYNEANREDPVSGIGGLINGLSGKFFCSVVALIFSVIFTFLERRSERALETAHDGLIARIRQLLPVLSPTRILSDIQGHSRSMAASVSNISSDFVGSLTKALRSDLAPAFAEGVSIEMAGRLQEEFRPTMQRMAETLDSLRNTIESVQAEKQESITEELRSMMSSLVTSLNESLRQMGHQFHAALTGAAKSEFGNIEKTLTGTAAVLQDMNAGFSGLQATINQLIEKAQQTTTDQLKAGREQVESMTAMMGGLMLKLQESTESNVNSVAEKLTVVVGNLTARTDEMINSVREATVHAAASGTRVMQEAGKWSADATTRLEELFNQMEVRAAEFRDAGQALASMQNSLKETIRQNNGALALMADASSAVQTYTASLSGQAKVLQEAGSQQAGVVALTKQVTANLVLLMEKHEALVTRYDNTLQEYRVTFESMDEEVASVLNAVQTGLRGCLQSIENNFHEIVKMTNDTVPDLAKVFSTQIEELNEQLQELGGVIDKGIKRLHAAAR